MPTIIPCPKCKAKLKLSKALAGRSVACPRCKSHFKIQAKSKPAQPDESNESQDDSDSVIRVGSLESAVNASLKAERERAAKAGPNNDAFSEEEVADDEIAKAIAKSHETRLESELTELLDSQDETVIEAEQDSEESFWSEDLDDELRRSTIADARAEKADASSPRTDKSEASRSTAIVNTTPSDGKPRSGHMMFHCWECDTLFSVPVTAAGHRARCHSCGFDFTLPESAPPSNHMPQSQEAADAAARHAALAKAAEAEEAVRKVETTDAANTGPASILHDNQKAPRARWSPSAAQGDLTDEADSSADDTPHLSLLSVDRNAASIQFPASYVSDPLFRASMPFRCMMTGSPELDTLIALPIIWGDQVRGDGTDWSVEALQSKYQHTIDNLKNPREVADAMSVMQELKPPFDQPIPYFVSNDAVIAGMSIVTRTFHAADGDTLMCEVVVPSPRYALDWMLRVNGVCDPTTAQFEQHLASRSEGWRSVPRKTRSLLKAWFEPQENERFIAYFNDADFDDESIGQAGLILTDRRIVFSKFQHHGEIQLTNNGFIVADVKGNVAKLMYIEQGQTRMVYLHKPDVDRFNMLLGRLETEVHVRVLSD